jgi:hypothetical protein
MTVLALWMAGCAQYQWQKRGATQAEFNRDGYECQMEAARAYPAAMVAQQITTGYTTPATTNCYSNGSAYGIGGTIYGNSNTNCTTTPGVTVQPIVIPTDMNANNRGQAVNAYMYARGWQYVQVK